MLKGVILAGGKGTRLLPITKTVNKHLVGILNKPMILYPLETLKYLGITEILIVSGGDHLGGIIDFLGDGSAYGVDLSYKVQEEAKGIGQALCIAEKFAGHDSIAVILGDNVFENSLLNVKINSLNDSKTHLFVKEMPSEKAKRFGVLDGDRILEKPKSIKTKTAQVVTGLYIYPPEVFAISKMQRPSARGEYEITDVNNFFLTGPHEIHQVEGFWSDAGVVESLKKTIDWAYEKEKTQDLTKGK